MSLHPALDYPPYQQRVDILIKQLVILQDEYCINQYVSGEM